MATVQQISLQDLLKSIHALEDDLRIYERKYKILSETFYTAYLDGEEPDDESWTLEWAGWAGAYESWQQLMEHYRKTVQHTRQNTERLIDLIQVAA